MSLTPVQRAFKPVWPVTYTHAISDLEWANYSDTNLQEHVKCHVTERLFRELQEAGIAYRPDDVDVTVEDHPDWPYRSIHITAKWSGCRDAERNFRLDFHGGPLDGRTMASDKVPPIFRHTATISRDVWYRSEGLDPVDGHWIYRYEGLAS